MKIMRLFLVVLGAFFLLFYPVSAFEINSLTIDLQPSGDATIGIDYTLSLPEKIGVYLNIADPGMELKKAFENNFHYTVTVDTVTDHSVRFTVNKFAQIRHENGSSIMSTPELPFTMAEKILDKYWFAALLHPDFSPGITRIIYPDGYVESFSNQEVIPGTEHTIT